MEAREVIDRMRADGASHEQIMGFVARAKAQARPQMKPARTPEELAANDQPLIREDPIGAIVGMGAGGGAAKLALGKLMPLVSTGVGRVAAGGLASAAGGAVGGAVEGVAGGASPADIAANAVGGAEAGAALGVPASIAAEGGRAVATALRRTKSLGPYLNARDAGVYQTDELKNMAKGPAGMQDASEATIERIASRESDLGGQAGKNWNMVGADPATLRKPVDVELIRARLEAGRQHHLDPDTGLPTNRAIVKAYEDALGGTGNRATVEGVLKRRQALKTSAAFDNPNPSPEQMAARDVYHTFRSAVHDASLELATADDAYSQYEREATHRSKLVGVPDVSAMTPTQEETATARVGRLADENKAGMRAQKRLGELAASDSEVADAMRILAAKKAQESVRFGMPHMPTDLSTATLWHGIPRAVAQNTRALGAKVLDPLSRALMNIERPTVGAGAMAPMSGQDVGFNPFIAGTMAAARKKKGN